MQQAIDNADKNLDAVYEIAYLLIDLSDSYVGSSISVNAAILAGMCFHFISSKEKEIVKSMASERLALRAYQHAIEMAHPARLPISLYAATHIVKFISQLKYLHPKSVDVMQFALKRALYCLDLVPFFSNLTSTFDLRIVEMYQIALMKSLLTNLRNRKESDAANHDYAKVIYFCYEKSLYDFHREKIEEEDQIEERARLKLQAIELRMHKDHDNVDEMKKLIVPPHIHLYCDSDGWRQLISELNFPSAANVKTYTAFNGFKVNKQTNEISLIMEPWKEGDSPTLKVFTDFDIVQMFQRFIKKGKLSLSSTDPQQPFNPLLEVTFDPPNLAGTEYLKTLFMVDYLLKMLASGAEISTKPPFKTRSIDRLLSALPHDLRESLNLNYYRDYAKNHNHKIRIHRFWWSIEEIERQEEVNENDEIYVRYRKVKGVLRHHLLDYLFTCINGEMTDSEEEDGEDSAEARYTANFNKNYNEIRKYVTEFLRLEELAKIAAAVSELQALHCLKVEENTVEVSGEKHLRVPGLFHAFSSKDSPDNFPDAVFGGVITCPKLRDKVLGTKSTNKEELSYHLNGLLSSYYTHLSLSSMQYADRLQQRDPFSPYRMREFKQESNHHKANQSSLVPSSVRLAISVIKSLGWQIPKPLTHFLKANAFFDRYSNNPSYSSVVEKVVASAAGYFAQTMPTKVCLGILGEGVLASFTLAPATGGMSLLAIPTAIIATPMVLKFGQQVGDLAQTSVHNVFAKVNQPRTSYPEKMIATLPPLRKISPQPSDRMISMSNYSRTNLPLFKSANKTKKNKTNNHVISSGEALVHKKNQR